MGIGKIEFSILIYLLFHCYAFELYLGKNVHSANSYIKLTSCMYYFIRRSISRENSV